MIRLFFIFGISLVSLWPSQYENEQRFFQAASAGNLEDLELLITTVNKNVQNGDGQTALHLAIAYKRTKAAIFLVENGVDLQIKDKDEVSALDWAIVTGKLKIVKLLYSCTTKSEMSKYNNNKQLPLHLLHLAALQGYQKIVKFLVQNGVDVDVLHTGLTALHTAAYYDRKEVVEFLIKSGAVVDKPDEEGETALHLAAEGGYVKIIKLLLECNSNIEAETLSKKTPLHIAAKKGKFEAAKYLIKKGARVNAVTNKGLTPLHFTARRANFLRVTQEESVMYITVEKEEVGLAKLLLEKGAEIEAVTKNGKTVFDFLNSIDFEHKEMISLFQEHKAALGSRLK